MIDVAMPKAMTKVAMATSMIVKPAWWRRWERGSFIEWMDRGLKFDVEAWGERSTVDSNSSHRLKAQGLPLDRLASDSS